MRIPEKAAFAVTMAAPVGAFDRTRSTNGGGLVCKLRHTFIVYAKVCSCQTFCIRYCQSMSPRTGRPKSANPRTNAIPIRLADDELALIRSAADKAGLSAGEWMRDKLIAAAKRAK